MRPEVQVDAVDVGIGEEVCLQALNERLSQPVLIEREPTNSSACQQQDGRSNPQYECARLDHGFSPSKLQCSTTVRAEALCRICTL